MTLQGTEMELIAIVDDDERAKGREILGRNTKDPSEIDELKADAILITSISEKERISQALEKRKNRTNVFSIS